MSTSFKKLYHQYINKGLSSAALDEFRRELDNVSDEKMWKTMLDEEEQSPSEFQIPAVVKEDIRKELHKIIWRQRWQQYMKYAASVIVVLSVSVGLYTGLNNQAVEQKVSITVKSGSKADIKLPDGTSVRLNAATDIQYDLSSKKERVVWLSGEAFFDVVPDRDRPFKVMAGDLQVKVTGTSFNVKTHQKGAVETSLLSGSVTISGGSLLREYKLSPGEKATYSAINKTLKTSISDMHVEAGWCDDYLIFYAKPLSEVIGQIERWYGVTIILQRPQISEDLLSGSFRNESIQNVVESLSRQYHFQYKIEKEIITIY